ncbi:MAG: TauD/TfdA family dioxygenase [Steroidobacteraceae bacterium]
MEGELAAALSQAVQSVLAAEGAGLVPVFEKAPRSLAQRVSAEVLGKLQRRYKRENLLQAFTGRAWLQLPGAFLVDDLPETPTDFLPVPDCHTTLRARLAMLGVHEILGKETIAYRSESDGGLFVNLVARPGQGRLAEKSTKGMRGHTDAVSFPFPGTADPDFPRIAPSPDLVTLAGLKNPNSIPTHIVPLPEILTRLKPEDIAELEKAQFIIQCQETFRAGTEAILGTQHMLSDAPVLHAATDGSMSVRFSHSKVVAEHDNAAATRAREAFIAACAEAVIPVPAIPGSILLINNRKALHGRSPVGDGHGANTRWLLRTYALAEEAIHPRSRYRDSAYQLFP